MVQTWIALLVVAVVAGCGGPTYTEPKEVEAKPPKVTYNFTSDEDLIEANSKARVFCSQYASTPAIKGAITKDSEGVKSVTFECVKAAVVTPPPPAPPMSYGYRTEMELLQAIQSSDAYCARSGQVASTAIVTNPDGTKTLTFQCVPR